MGLIAIGVLVLAVPFVLPIALWVALYRTRTRLALLEEALNEQREVLNRVSGQLAQLNARPAAAQPAACGGRAARGNAAPARSLAPAGIQAARRSAIGAACRHSASARPAATCSAATRSRRRLRAHRNRRFHRSRLFQRSRRPHPSTGRASPAPSCSRRFPASPS